MEFRTVLPWQLCFLCSSHQRCYPNEQQNQKDELDAWRDFRHPNDTLGCLSEVFAKVSLHLLGIHQLFQLFPGLFLISFVLGGHQKRKLRHHPFLHGPFNHLSTIVPPKNSGSREKAIDKPLKPLSPSFGCFGGVVEGPWFQACNLDTSRGFMGPTSLDCLEEQRTSLLIWGLPSPWVSFIEATVQYPSEIGRVVSYSRILAPLWANWTVVGSESCSKYNSKDSCLFGKEKKNPSLPLTLVSLEILVPSSSKKLPTPSKLLKWARHKPLKWWATVKSKNCVGEQEGSFTIQRNCHACTCMGIVWIKHVAKNLPSNVLHPYLPKLYPFLMSSVWSLTASAVSTKQNRSSLQHKGACMANSVLGGTALGGGSVMAQKIKKKQGWQALKSSIPSLNWTLKHVVKAYRSTKIRV